jgi:hypothetical protein
MRYLPIFLILLTGAATAQVTTPMSTLTNDQEAALFGLPVLATVGATALLVRADVPAVAFGLPLVPVAAVCATGAALGIDGDCLTALRSTALWSLPGYALIAASYGASLNDARFGFIVIGALYLLVVPPIAAVESYRLSAVRVAPTVLSDPADRHRSVPGLQVRIAF